ncbi:phage regulatory CII family protein [Shewanella oncorhynchi]|uniref:phage regulatory CII family protein n=1 Tax=Shewanella oncorhynchi TaxID=2726434 RepID=UPI003D7ABACF
MSKLTLKRQSLSCTDPLYAAHALGHDYGVDKLAKDLFQQPGVMYNKLNPDNDSNHLYLRDAIHLTELADDDRIVSAWCHSRGGVFVKLPAAVNCDEELSDQLLLISEQMGIALAEIRDSRADGVITPDEFERIGRELTNTVREVLSLKAVVSSQVRELPQVNDFSIELKPSNPVTVAFSQALSKSASNE